MVININHSVTTRVEFSNMMESSNINHSVTTRVEFSNMMESSNVYYLFDMIRRFDVVGNFMTFVMNDQFVHQHF